MFMHAKIFSSSVVPKCRTKNKSPQTLSCNIYRKILTTNYDTLVALFADNGSPITRNLPN